MTDVGELYPLGVVIRDTDGDPLNAQNVALTVTRPDLTIELPPVANPPAETGRYVCDYVPNQPGPYRYRWVATSPALVFEGSFDVEEPGSVGLISLEVAKKLLKIPVYETDEDDDIMSTVRAATVAAENETGKVLARRTIVEHRWLMRPTYRYAVARRPVLSLTSVAVDNGPVLVPPAVYITVNGVVTVRGGGPLRDQIVTTYTAGPAVNAPHTREAVGYIVQHLWANRLGSSARPRIGGQSGADTAAEVAAYSIPNRARDLLGRRGPLVG